MDENITPEESFLLITKTIEETKKKFIANGHIMILWGSLTFIVFVSQYIFVLTGLYKLFDIGWTNILFLFGGIYTLIYTWEKIKRKNLPKTILGRIINTMSWVFGANLMILGIFFGHRFGVALGPLFLILFALFIIMVGISIKFNPITIGGIILNLMGFAAFYISPQYHGLLLALGGVIAMIIPGILLNKAKRKENV
ncbi:MAG: hypothetical protein WBV81_02210 [Ignavibacteriaceae bacterium]